jgi:hypothetical protein
MWWLDREKYNGRRFDASPKFDVVNDERCVCWDCWQAPPLISAFSFCVLAVRSGEENEAAATSASAAHCSGRSIGGR